MSKLFAGILALFVGARCPEIRLDPRVELSAALQLLASTPDHPLPGFRDDGSAYALLLSSATAAERGHPAVAAYARAMRRPDPGRLAFTTPAHTIRRCLDGSLRLRTSRPDCRRSGLAFAAADFAARTRFAALMPRLEALEEPSLLALRSARDRADLKSVYEKYSGLRTVPQRVAPSPLLEPGRVWNDYAPREDGRPARLLTVISPVAVSTGAVPVSTDSAAASTDSAAASTDSVTATSVTASTGSAAFAWGPVMVDFYREQAHSALDGTADAADAADGPPPPGAPQACYGSWKQCVREHVAQGISLRLVQIARKTGLPPDAPDATLNSLLPWQGLVAKWLKDGYEAHRDRYKTLRDFVPVIVRRLRAQAALLPARKEPPQAEAAAGAARAAKAESDEARGLKLYAAKRWQDAQAAFSAAVDEGGGAPALMDLAAALRAEGRTGPAVRALDRAVEDARSDPSLDPYTLADALSSRADIKAASGDWAGAAADLREALSAAPLDWARRAETERLLRGGPSGR
ncbi:MAG: DUF4932 domain-containing protein [Elusimicrobia bacterium]|nr:DUF4932 domain-containing protein [Elusimicrobiota bacterium]